MQVHRHLRALRRSVLPGATDIAWDVAGTFIEWRLSRFEAEAFLARDRVRSGDQTIALRLPFYRAAYAAFRLGYVTMSGDALADSDDETHLADAARFAALRRQYAHALQRELRAVALPPHRLNQANVPFIPTVRVGASYSAADRAPRRRPQMG